MFTYQLIDSRSISYVIYKMNCHLNVLPAHINVGAGTKAFTNATERIFVHVHKHPKRIQLKKNIRNRV